MAASSEDICRGSPDARIAQPISGLIERGITSGPKLEAVLDDILIGREEVDAVLMACTHYPAARAVIQAKLHGVELVDPVESWTDRMARA